MSEPSRSLLAEIADQPPPNRLACRVSVVLAALPIEDATDLRAAISGIYTSAAISAALRKRGVKLPKETIGRHRRGDCRCQIS